MGDVLEVTPLTLQTIANGELAAAFEALQKEVFESFSDPQATGARKITLTISYKPEDDTTKVAFEAKVKIERTPHAGSCAAIRTGFNSFGLYKAKQSDMFTPLKAVNKEQK